jgi:hypothetical protein
LTPVYTIGSDIAWDTTANGYRLPTEAEWEFAARAEDDAPYSGSAVAADVGWTSDTSGSTQPVSRLLFNGNGLYDMSGNVFEWCWDWHNTDYYASSPTMNPLGPNGPLVDRVERGGAYTHGPQYARISDRNRRDTPDTVMAFTGLRLAKNAPGVAGACEVSATLQVDAKTAVAHSFDADVLPEYLFAAVGGGGDARESVDDFYLENGSGVVHDDSFSSSSNWCQASGSTFWRSSGFAWLQGVLAHKTASVPGDSDILLGSSFSFYNSSRELRLLSSAPGSSCTADGNIFLRATVQDSSSAGACLHFNQESTGEFLEVACDSMGSWGFSMGYRDVDLDVVFSPECGL